MMQRKTISQNNQSNVIPLPVVGSSVFGRYPKISSEETYNMMISDGALVPTPGYKSVATIAPTGEARELYNSPRYGRLIAVIGENLYTISQNFGIAKIAQLQSAAGAVFIAENDAGQIAIVDGLNIYIFNYLDNSFKQTPTDFQIDFQPVYIGFQDGYFIAGDGLSNRWRLSEPNNGLSWPDLPSNVGVIQTKVDFTVATVPLSRQLFVFGKISCEQWYDVGYQLFPYQRNNFYSINYGCLNSQTIATGTIINGQQERDIVCWLGSNEKSGPAILVSDGGPPTQLSTDGITYKIEQLTHPENSFGFIYKQGGHLFYQITFYTDNVTFLYDFNTKQFFTLTDENMQCHIAKRIAFFNGNYYFLSIRDGKLYQLDLIFTDYDGVQIPRVRIFPHFRNPIASRNLIKNINFTMEQGEAQGDSFMDLSLSVDGGASFGNIVRQQLKPIGNRANKLQFWRLGVDNDLVIKTRFLTHGRVVVNAATLEYA